ncbi:uncharacterized protein LOC5503909 isoform X2 [Nematostella vectensis]|uniref:uncharacterized protein LOC5503909 isoform X2 n=1 Tax=Nematostella vectensis TaxID=45351 RepID=UPI002076FB1E|nr:uncharacterized protein LOC5503909 isoform X2 [Nematostella vectensis]
MLYFGCCLMFLMMVLTSRAAISDDLDIPFRGQSVSFVYLQNALNTSVYWKPSNEECSAELLASEYLCNGKCGGLRTNIKGHCYCDEKCLELGDCCLDYRDRCTDNYQWDFVINDPKQSCVDINDDLNKEPYIFVSGCPNNYVNTGMVAKCNETASNSDLVSGIPVFDMRSNVSYRNVYCASCNAATNLSYWQLSIRCDDSSGISANTTTAELMEYARRSCALAYKPRTEFWDRLLSCKIKDSGCPPVNGQSLTTPFEITRAICELYSLPYGPDDRRNPHCALCRKEETLSCPVPARPPPPIPPPHPPALTILFDVNTGDSYKISISGDVQKETTGSYSCNSSQVFDPFTLQCVNLPQPIKQHQDKHNQTLLSLLGENCTVAMLNTSYVTFNSNGSIVVTYKDLERTYENGSYIVINDTVYLCWRDTSVTQQSQTGEKSLSTLQILTYVFTGLSLLAEVALLLLYLWLKELRNVPGKILMSLVFCLLVNQVFFLMLGLNQISGFCVAVAVIVHYFLLAAFAWMSVMAYDVMKTFASKAVLQASNSRKTFIKYCCAAFTFPAIVVFLSIVLDKTDAVHFGYGTGVYCWITELVPLIVTFHVPIAMVIVFNACALVSTMVGIRRTEKSSNMARPNSQASTTSRHAFLCLKLSTVMGFPWLLGLISTFVTSPYLQYPYVILNSLQGFFIFLAFATNNRTVGLFRGKFGREKSSEKSISRSTQQTEL